MYNSFFLVLALVAGQQGPQKQWYQLTNFPGYEGYGALNPNGWLLPERTRPAQKLAQKLATVAAPVAAAAAQPAPRPVAPAGDPYGFTAWLNSTRAGYGLPAVGYDPNLTNWAAMNNSHQSSRGMGHYVMVRRGIN